MPSLAGAIVVLISGLTWLWAYQQFVQTVMPDEWQKAYVNGNTVAAIALVIATQYHTIPLSLLMLSVLAAILIDTLLKKEANHEHPG
jgi:hypothetical protein